MLKQWMKIERNADVLKRYGVKQIGLFGSLVRDEGKESSDIDLLVDFEKEKKHFLILFN
jgi:predicted nucleotidyltransferase